jgi:cytochrome c peroxidase
LGRTDATSGETSPEECGLPDADKGSRKNTIQHIRDVFYRKICFGLHFSHLFQIWINIASPLCTGMGFSDREIVALLGAHALGRCHTDRSGYWGPWTFAENTFSNEYFRLLLEERWSPKVSHNGKPWDGPDQFEDSTGKLMMLPSDMVLIQDPAFRKIVELYAKDESSFFKDFASAFAKLLDLGVEFPSAKPWYQFW